MKKAYLGIDIGSISTKGVIIDEEKNILAGIYLWTEGNPMGAAKKSLLPWEKKLIRMNIRSLLPEQPEVPASLSVPCVTPAL